MTTGWQPSEAYPDPAIVTLDPRFDAIKPPMNAGVERLFYRLPLERGAGVVRRHARCVVERHPEQPHPALGRGDRQVSVFRKPSNHANGNTRDRQGRLVTCEHGGRQVTRTEHDGTITVICNRFGGVDGKPLNSPNDVVVKSDGSIWFTDPMFGIAGNYEGHKAEPELPMNVYRVDGRTGRATVVAENIAGPNGLCFSPDEKLLYLVESRARAAQHQGLRCGRRRRHPRQPARFRRSARAARRTGSGATSTAICGAAGA